MIGKLSPAIAAKWISAENNADNRTKRIHRSTVSSPVAPPGATMAISFQSDEELIRFGKEVRRLAENPFQRQLDEARAEWKRRKARTDSTSVDCPEGHSKRTGA
jgi:hypothetical protein